jgi:hypothetical protein
MSCWEFKLELDGSERAGKFPSLGRSSEISGAMSCWLELEWSETGWVRRKDLPLQDSRMPMK